MTAIDWMAVAETFSQQARFCAASPSSVAILQGCAAALAGPHVLRDILIEAHDLTRAAAVPLRVLGAVHRVALDGRAPELAQLLPSCGGIANASRVWAATEDVLKTETRFIASYLARAPQTNEVGRSAALLGGFLTIATETKLPLRLLEIGASAGLNLSWDRYRVTTPSFVWGTPESGVDLPCDWTGAAPPLNAGVNVIERTGCDLAPIDLASTEDRRRMESYIWADQVDRLDRMRAAVATARRLGVLVDRADARDWLARKLAIPAPGAATVIFHSIMWQYLLPDTATAIDRAIRAAGERATSDAPIAWLAMEPPGRDPGMPELALTLWPGGERRALAHAHFHGAWVKWAN